PDRSTAAGARAAARTDSPAEARTGTGLAAPERFGTGVAARTGALARTDSARVRTGSARARSTAGDCRSSGAPAGRSRRDQAAHIAVSRRAHRHTAGPAAAAR